MATRASRATASARCGRPRPAGPRVTRRRSSWSALWRSGIALRPCMPDRNRGVAVRAALGGMISGTFSPCDFLTSVRGPSLAKSLKSSPSSSPEGPSYRRGLRDPGEPSPPVYRHLAPSATTSTTTARSLVKICASSQLPRLSLPAALRRTGPRLRAAARPVVDM